MQQILVVEDDVVLNTGLCKALREEGRSTVSCTNLRDASAQLACGGVSLVILDVNLPDGSGYALLREIKKNTPQLPVIMLTANDTDSNIADGLDAGADDYITKPFSLTVLRARINAAFRKSGSGDCHVIKEGKYVFDFENMIFTVCGNAVELSKTEQKLLRILVINKGATLSRSDLVDRIWTDGAQYVDENALSVTVKRLRSKLSSQQCIKTVYAIGYKWMGDSDD